MEPINQKNLAETLSEVLPRAEVLQHIETGADGYEVSHIALPKGTKLREVKTDLESLLPNPRRTNGTAVFSDVDSFLAYVKRHAADGSAAWCKFDPQTFALDFTAVFDEHENGKAGWRAHKAQFTPDMSSEWKAWKKQDRQPLQQVAFAEWIQEHQDDITTAAGLPTSLQMLEMATNFVMNEERALKSTVRLNSGGVRLTYIADADKGTTEDMRLFEQFAIGIPVFHGGTAWAITARLKYRNNSGKVSFFYELARPDRVHDGAARELIERVRAGLGSVPMFMGHL